MKECNLTSQDLHTVVLQNKINLIGKGESTSLILLEWKSIERLRSDFDGRLKFISILRLPFHRETGRCGGQVPSTTGSGESKFNAYSSPSN